MKAYLDLLQQINHAGVMKSDRTQVGTKSLVGMSLRHDLSKSFPLLTTKFVNFKSIAYELLWFLTGSENLQFLQENNVNIWNAWADDAQNIGPMYGSQWCNWNHQNINQLDNALYLIKNEPDSRRIIVSAWNPAKLPQQGRLPHENPPDFMALAPCHTLFQFFVHDRKLSCLFYQRSGDIFLGVPFNIASYALLTHMMAQQAGLDVGELIFMGGDCHLYLNHQEQAAIQLKRTPLPLPQLQILRHPPSLYEYHYQDFVLLDYQHHPRIYAPIAI